MLVPSAAANGGFADRRRKPELATAPRARQGANVRRKLTQRGKDRRRQLMEHAAELFAERGYHPTSVADIVDEPRRRQGRLLLVLRVEGGAARRDPAEASNHDLRKRQQQAIGDEPDPVRRIELGIRASIEWFREHREYFAIIQFAATDETFAPVLRRNREIAIADTIRHLKDGIVDGRIARPATPRCWRTRSIGVVQPS